MATVTGFTAARMQEIEDAVIVGAEVVDGDLILTLHDSSTVNAGSVLGPGLQSVNAQTGTTYTVDGTDCGKLVTLSNAAPITLTLPQDSSETIPIGTYVDFYQLGAGQVTIVAGSGATLHQATGLNAKSRDQYSRFGVQKVSANTYSVFGDLEVL